MTETMMCSNSHVSEAETNVKLMPANECGCRNIVMVALKAQHGT